MYLLVGLLCLLLSIVAIMAGRRIHVTATPDNELLGLARAGLIVSGGFLVIAALILVILGVNPPG
jgi:hypothetical protein